MTLVEIMNAYIKTYSENILSKNTIKDYIARSSFLDKDIIKHIAKA
jgi:hypothetical protein